MVALALRGARHLAFRGLSFARVLAGWLVACGASPGPVASPSPSWPAALSTPDDEASSYGYRFEIDAPRLAKPPSVPGPPRGPEGRVTPEEVQARVREHMGAIEGCYRSGLVGDPGLAGLLTVRLVIEPDGVVRRAVALPSDLPDAGVVRCVVAAFQSLRYPSGPGLLTVEYPIAFAP